VAFEGERGGARRGPGLAGIAVGADDDGVGGHRAAASGLDAPARAGAYAPGRRRVAVDPGARRDRRFREPARVAQWLDRAAAAIEPAAQGSVRAEQARPRP